jgi:hypothetical protein
MEGKRQRGMDIGEQAREEREEGRGERWREEGGK